MNFDLYEFLKYHNGSKFYPVKVEDVSDFMSCHQIAHIS